MTLRHSLSVLSFALLLAGTAAAQLPRGTAVYSKARNPRVPGTPPGGLVTFEPFRGNFQSVTGLPSVLEGTAPAYPSPPTLGVGPNSVLVRDRDGALFVGPIVRNGHPLSIFEIQLNGSAATVTASWRIAAAPTSNTGILVDQMAWLPSGDLLFSHRGPMVGFPSQGLSILNLTTAPGTVTQLPFNPLPSDRILNALAVDPSGTTAYVGMFGVRGLAGTSQIYSVPLPGGGVPSAELATPVSGNISQLGFDCAGQLHAAVQGGSPTAGLLRIPPGPSGTRGVVQLSPASNINALTFDGITGEALLTDGSAMTGTMSMHRFNGGLLVVPGMPANDAPTGLALRASMATFGSPAANRLQSVAWLLCPNPGGAPTIPATGTNPFSLSFTVTPNTSAGAVFLGLGRLPGPRNLPGISNLLLDPARLLVGLPLNPTLTPATYTVPLAIPAGLPPGTLIAQAFHANPGLGIVTGSEGLEIAIH